MASAAGRKAVNVGLVGGHTLLGKELEEVLKSGASVELTSYSSTGEGNFGEQDGEPVYLQPLDRTSIEEHDFFLLAGSAEGAQKAYSLAKAARRKPLLIDCHGDLEAHPEARIVAPLLEDAATPGSWVLIPAHPAAHALAVLLMRMVRLSTVRQCIAHVFEPASERGQRGLGELHTQTMNLLSFKPLDKRVYDAQLAFNLLSQFGEDAPLKLSAIEHRMERHLATLLSRQPAPAPAMPSLRVVQAPVFHGYSISMWVEFDRNVSAQEVREALASAQVEVRGEEEEAPDIAGAAGQSGVIAGDIRGDRNNGRAVWLWVVTDNLRLMADAAAAIIRQGGSSLS